MIPRTLKDQIRAAGGSLTNDTEAASVILLVNNFSHQPQTEAPHQPLNRSPPSAPNRSRSGCVS